MSDNCLSQTIERYHKGSMCESPGCKPRSTVEKALGKSHAGEHRASVAMRMHREMLQNPERTAREAKEQFGTYKMAGLATDDGVLLCACCAAKTLRLFTENGMPQAYLNVQPVGGDPEAFKYTDDCLERANRLSPRDTTVNRIMQTVDVQGILTIARTEGIEAAKRALAEKIVQGIPEEIFGDIKRPSKPQITNDERLDIHDILGGMSRLPKDIKLN